MPLGSMVKPTVRREAKKRGLATANKPDSQGICFVGEVGVREFLSRYIEVEPGPIVDQHGTELGEHDGAVFYTIGQRHGLGVGGGLPYYVTHKDMASNTVFVTNDVGDERLWTQSFLIRDWHWINSLPDDARRYHVRTRHRAPLIEATVTQYDDVYRITLQDPERAIAPGQSAVVYEDERVVGGGIISQYLPV